MPPLGSVADDVVQFLKSRKNGATMAEIGQGVRSRRGHTLQHTVRSSVYRNLDDHGKRLFRREGEQGGRKGRYFLSR
jgi:hypothetical protein